MKLSGGGRVLENLQRRPWGTSDGQVVDRYGLHWLIGFEVDDSVGGICSHDELREMLTVTRQALGLLFISVSQRIENGFTGRSFACPLVQQTCGTTSLSR